jgi:tRNA pseudouridine32 synthase / 23S rRNA pseudouridine746 synthase
MSIAPTPARIRLPRLDPPPATILEFLCGHFPHIPRDVWRARMESGSVKTDAPVSVDTPYLAGAMVTYFREVRDEPQIPFVETVVHEDERLLVVDKPHFVPVTPGGDVVNECLLFRLQRKTGNLDLAPVHRLDRDTAGLVTFVKNKAHRASYAQVFETGRAERTYSAIARVGGASPSTKEWTVENRLEPEPGSFRMMAVEGVVNARTIICLEEVRSGLGRFSLRPSTGKKHQLRIHMNSLGFPILNDPFYPVLTRCNDADYSQPLQLLASELAFVDPISSKPLRFTSNLTLSSWL